MVDIINIVLGKKCTTIYDDNCLNIGNFIAGHPTIYLYDWEAGYP
jgi:hypothetical protein